MRTLHSFLTFQRSPGGRSGLALVVYDPNREWSIGDRLMFKEEEYVVQDISCVMPMPPPTKVSNNVTLYVKKVKA